MANLRYYNQSGPFWDFISSLEGQDWSNHPLMKAYAGPSAETAVDRDMDAQDYGVTSEEKREEGSETEGEAEAAGAAAGPAVEEANPWDHLAWAFGSRGGRGGGRGRGRRGPPGFGRHGPPPPGPPPPFFDRAFAHREGPPNDFQGPPPPPFDGPFAHPSNEQGEHDSGREGHPGPSEQGHRGPHMEGRFKRHGPPREGHSGRHGRHGPPDDAHSCRRQCRGPSRDVEAEGQGPPEEGHLGRHGPPHHGSGHRGGPHGRGGHGRHGRGGPRGFGMGGTPFNMTNIAEFLQSQIFGDEAANKDTAKGDEDFVPPVDIFDTEAAFVIHVSLPGAKKEDIGVHWDAEKSEVNITGVILRPGDEDFLKTLALDERKVGAFERKVRLGSRANPAQVDAECITAKLEDGILRLNVPKEDKEFDVIHKIDVE